VQQHRHQQHMVTVNEHAVEDLVQDLFMGLVRFRLFCALGPTGAEVLKQIVSLLERTVVDRPQRFDLSL
jgi:hypothetical protein